MRREEFLALRWGLFLDLMECDLIFNGAREYKKKYTYDEAMALR